MPQMGRELLNWPGHSVFKDTIKILDKHLRDAKLPPRLDNRR